MLESEYQRKLIKKLEWHFPGCIVLKNDSGYRQGIPDLTILYKDKWAVLEVKASLNAAAEPNQEWYVDTLNGMSFAAFICPETERGVLRDLQRTFEPRRNPRLLESK